MNRLNVTRGVSLSHDTQATASPTVTTNINIQSSPPTTTVEQASPASAAVSEVSYPDTAPDGASLGSDEPRLKRARREVKPIQEREVELPPVLTSEQQSLVSPYFNEVNENDFLKSIIKIYMSEPFTYKGKSIICSADELIQLVQILTGGTVTIDTSELDIDCGCCSGQDLPIKNVNKIWVTKDEETTVFRYSYPHFLNLFEIYKISLKYIHE